MFLNTFDHTLNTVKYHSQNYVVAHLFYVLQSTSFGAYIANFGNSDSDEHLAETEDDPENRVINVFL